MGRPYSIYTCIIVPCVKKQREMNKGGANIKQKKRRVQTKKVKNCCLGDWILKEGTQMMSHIQIFVLQSESINNFK